MSCIIYDTRKSTFQSLKEFSVPFKTKMRKKSEKSLKVQRDNFSLLDYFPFFAWINEEDKIKTSIMIMKNECYLMLFS